MGGGGVSYIYIYVYRETEGERETYAHARACAQNIMEHACNLKRTTEILCRGTETTATVYVCLGAHAVVSRVLRCILRQKDGHMNGW